MEPQVARLEGVQVQGNRLSTERVRLKTGLEPGSDGRYVYSQEDRRFYAANSFAAAVQALEVFQEAYGEPIRWATGKAQLEVTPDAGENLNAYYSRWEGGLFFFHSTDPKTSETVYSGGSGEVVAHELGHAILDALRPGYFSTWSADPGAFHEAFGDVLALLVSLKNEAVLERVVEQTGGDLSRPNLAAALGEQLGQTINHTSGHNSTGGDYTRNAINEFTWQDPDTLPGSAPPDQLSSEVHSYSRLWTGAFYDVIKGIAAEKLASGVSARQALAETADEGLAMLARQMRHAPDGDFTYKDMALALLKSESEGNQGRHSELIRRAFTARKILPEELGLLPPEPPARGSYEVHHVLDHPALGPLQGARISTLLSGQPELGLLDDDRERNRLQRDIVRLWERGDILMTEPNQVVRPEHLFRPDGEAYLGVVRWVDGSMRLERVPIGQATFQQRNSPSGLNSKSRSPQRSGGRVEGS